MQCKYCGADVPQESDFTLPIGNSTVRFCSEDCRTLWDLNRKRKAAEGRAKKQAEKRAKAETLAEIKEDAEIMKQAETVELSKPLDAAEEAYHVVEGVKAEYGENADDVLIHVMLRLNNEDSLATKYSGLETTYRKATEIISNADDAVKAMLRRLL